MRRLLLLLIVFSLSTGYCDAQLFKNRSSNMTEKGFFGRLFSGGNEVKVREPRAVVKAKRKQEANERRLEREYDRAVRKSRKRSYKIQTSDVQARMKANRREIRVRERLKRKNDRSATRKAAKKYR